MSLWMEIKDDGPGGWQISTDQWVKIYFNYLLYADESGRWMVCQIPENVFSNIWIKHGIIAGGIQFAKDMAVHEAGKKMDAPQETETERFMRTGCPLQKSLCREAQCGWWYGGIACEDEKLAIKPQCSIRLIAVGCAMNGMEEDKK